MENVEYTSSTGGSIVITYFENPRYVEDELRWTATISRRALEMLLDAAGFTHDASAE
jgi:hypothetical protein